MIWLDRHWNNTGIAQITQNLIHSIMIAQGSICEAFDNKTRIKLYIDITTAIIDCIRRYVDTKKTHQELNWSTDRACHASARSHALLTLLARRKCRAPMYYSSITSFSDKRSCLCQPDAVAILYLTGKHWLGLSESRNSIGKYCNGGSDIIWLKVSQLILIVVRSNKLPTLVRISAHAFFSQNATQFA